MIWGALRLHEATTDPHYFKQAVTWTGVLDRHYWIADHGGYATSADDTTDVIARLRPGSDDATPNANAIMMANLVALTTLSGEAKYAESATAILAAFGSDLGRNVIAHTGLLAGAIDLIAPQQVVLAGHGLKGGNALIEAIRNISLPGALQYGLDGEIRSELPALRDKPSINGQSAVYACLGPQCPQPLTDPAELSRILKAQRLYDNRR
jgi:uncharacterized protein YyaL (SSP411 family)